MSSRTDTPDVSPLSRPELQARAMGFMFLAATVVGFFAGFFPSEHIRAPEVFGYSTIFFIPVVSLLTTIACFTTGARWNRWMWLLMLLGTNVLVGNAIYNAGTVPSGAEVFLMWTLLFAGFFMSRTDAVVVGLQACIVMAIVIAIGPATVKPVTLFTMLMGSFIGVAVVVAALKYELESALRRNHLDAITDELTGLGNRRRLFDDLATLLATPPTTPTAVAMFDLDGFKAVNDRFGHHEGDDLLRFLGSRLADVVGDTGRAYRLGGDEFCVVLSTADEPLYAAIERAREALTEQTGGYDVGASCGRVELVGGEDASELLRVADKRLYDDKQKRKLRSAGHHTAIAS